MHGCPQDPHSPSVPSCHRTDPRLVPFIACGHASIITLQIKSLAFCLPSCMLFCCLYWATQQPASSAVKLELCSTETVWVTSCLLIMRMAPAAQHAIPNMHKSSWRTEQFSLPTLHTFQPAFLPQYSFLTSHVILKLERKMHVTVCADVASITAHIVPGEGLHNDAQLSHYVTLIET